MANFITTPEAEQSPIEVAGSSTFGRYKKISPAMTYNMFMSDEWMVSFAGFKRFLRVASGNDSCRALFRSVRGEILVAVVGQKVYRISSAYGVTHVGDIQSTIGRVFIDENLNSQICIVDGTYAYIYNYNDNDSFTQQSGGPLGTILIPNYVSFHNTFFLFGNANMTGDGARWYAYRYDSPTTIVTQAEMALSTKPDTARAIIRIPGQGGNILVLGRTVGEIWTAVGELQPYRRNPSTNIDYGCLSVSTIATGGSYVVWLAINEDNTPVIMVLSAEGISQLSTDGIDHLLSRVSRPDISSALFYKQDGHLFYQLTFHHEDDNLTLVYDFNTQMFFNLSDFDGSFHPAKNMVYFNNKLFFASLKDPFLYESSTDYVSYNYNLAEPGQVGFVKEDVKIIPRIRICSPVSLPDSGRFVINYLTFNLEQGADSSANVGDEDYKPRIDLRVSSDSGITWSNAVSRMLNPVGKRKNIVTYNKLGIFNDFTVKISFFGLSRFVVSGGVVGVY